MCKIGLKHRIKSKIENKKESDVELWPKLKKPM